MHAFRWLLIVLGLTGIACDWDKFDPRLDPSGASGGSGGSGAAAGGGPQGGGPTGGSAPGSVCASVALLDDDYGDDELSQLWIDAGQGRMVAEMGGALSLGVGATTGDQAFYTTRHFHDFSGAQEIAVDVTAATGNAVTSFELLLDASNRLAIRSFGANFEFVKMVDGTSTVLGMVGYSPAMHASWRLRSDGTDFFWESSADGGEPWVNHASEPLSALFALDYVKVRLLVDNTDATAASGTFDNLRSGGVGMNAWCPIADLADDFEDGRRDERWIPTSGTAEAHSREFQGQLFIDLPADTMDAEYFYRTSRPHDMTSAGVSVKVVRAPDPPMTVRLIASAADGSDGWVKMELFDGTLRANYFVMGGETALPEENSHDIGSGEYWRIREEGNNFVWELSQDGSTWTEFAQVTKPFDDTSGMWIELGGITHASHPDPGALIFDDLNVEP